MLVARLEVPEGTRLLFQPEGGPITSTEFHDLGLVVLAETHADETTEAALADTRMVLDCRGVGASELSQSMNWPAGEPTLPGTIRFGSQSYPATLQIRPRPRGLRAILRRMA